MVTVNIDDEAFQITLILSFIILLIIIVILYWVYISTLSSSECKYMNNLYSSLNGNIRPLSTSDPDCSGNLRDYYIKTAYNACSLTLHPGLGEGFGYPIFESLACGTSSIHGDYAGGADVLHSCGYADSLIAPSAFRVEGIHNQVRPCYEPGAWVERALEKLEEEVEPERLRASISHLSWANLWPLWQAWFDKGVPRG